MPESRRENSLSLRISPEQTIPGEAKGRAGDLYRSGQGAGRSESNSERILRLVGDESVAVGMMCLLATGWMRPFLVAGTGRAHLGSAWPPASGSPSPIWAARSGAGQLLRECAGALLCKTCEMAACWKGRGYNVRGSGGVLTPPRTYIRTVGDQDREKQGPTGVCPGWLQERQVRLGRSSSFSDALA